MTEHGGTERAPEQTRLVDLSHPIAAGMVTYPGLPGPEITAHLSHEDSRGRYSPGTEFAIGRISMVGNTGTYVDSPYHRFPSAPDLAGLPLESVAALPVTVVRLDDAQDRAIGPDAVAGGEVRGRAVLLRTGWSRHFGTDAYGRDAPFLTRDAAELLAAGGAALVGIDSVNIDDVADGDRPAHTVLLGAGIPVLEHLTNLAAVPVSGAVLHAAPPAVRGMASFPVRAYAVVPELR
jgi:arylformamidase